MFSNNLKYLIDSDFSSTNYGRILLLDKFEYLISELKLKKKLKIAVIGGTHEEPEVVLLKKMGYETDTHTFGIEDYDDFYLDLNLNNNKFPDKNFDLVICAQVLEHIWNVTSFIDNICKVMTKDTYAFIHCPKSNIHHGHTFYSAGYSKDFLEEIFKNHTEIIDIGELGTPRLYTSIHLLKHWINTEEAQTGKINYQTWFSYLWNLNRKKPKIKNIFKNIIFSFSIRRLIINLFLKGLENNLSDDKLVKTESFIFVRNKN